MNSVLSTDSILRNAVKKLIVVDISLRHPTEHLEDRSDDKLNAFMTKMHEINEMKLVKRSDVIEKLREVESDVNVINFLLLNLVKIGDVYTFSNLELEFLMKSRQMLKRTWKKSFAPWEGETMFLKGEYSNFVTSTDESEIKKFFPNSKIETISKSGHWPHIDNHNEFITKVVEFIR